jgi:PhoPQ-activated pathogenicity-related protein
LAATSSFLGWGAARADLDSYLSRPEPVYHWEERGVVEADGCSIHDLHLVSQVWQGMTWEHRLKVFVPTNAEYPHFCALLNTGGNGRERDTQMGVRMARDSGAVYAILYDVPNQPLFGGKKEDALVVHTWLEFLRTGDESWPLHFPMCKAVIGAMTAVQELARKSGWPEVNGFMIHGASKRGWTSWLAGASGDSRVRAIAPMAIDVLNLRAQQVHQIETYGAMSERIDEYDRAGITEKLDTPRGHRLVELEDPYSYRKRLTLPKLVIVGTNDRYWTQDALNLYWDGLKGPKWVLYVPNSGHGLEDRERVHATLIAFIRMIAGGGRWPKMQWSFKRRSGGVRLRLESDIPAVEGRLFHVSSRTKDFRDSHWSYEPMRTAETEKHGARPASAMWPEPEDGYAAIFGEAVYDLGAALRDTGPLAEESFAARFKEHPLANVHAFAGFDQIQVWEREFLPAEDQGKYENSVGYQPTRG